MVRKIRIFASRCEWGNEQITPQEDTAAHDAFEAMVCDMLQVSFPETIVTLSVDRRVSGGCTQITVYADNAREEVRARRRIEEVLGEAWEKVLQNWSE